MEDVHWTVIRVPKLSQMLGGHNIASFGVDEVKQNMDDILILQTKREQGSKQQVCGGWGGK